MGIFAPAAVLSTPLSFPALWFLAFVPCCLGFINPIYVFSVGYGLAVAAEGAGLLALAVASGVWIPALALAHVFGAVVYGIRLSAFLYWRSVTWEEWGKRAKNAPEAKAQSPLQKLLVSVGCALVYALMGSPMLFHVEAMNIIPASTRPVIYIGLAIQWLGALIEGVADFQKSAYKRTDEGKTRWCETGLYAACRHPNYLGEIMFWCGTFIAGVPAMAAVGWLRFIPASLGLAFILWLMTSQAKKQDEKQAGRYGDSAEYKAWVLKSGSLFPKLI